jgi:hypothetical protein
MTGVPLFVMQTKEEAFTGRGDSIVTVKLVIRVGRFSMDLGGGLFHSLGPTSLKNRYGLGNFFSAFVFPRDLNALQYRYLDRNPFPGSSLGFRLNQNGSDIRDLLSPCGLRVL